MPEYHYQCRACQQPFTVTTSIHDTRDNVVCSHCHSQNIYRDFSGIAVNRGAMFPMSCPAIPVDKNGSCGQCCDPKNCEMSTTP